MKFVFNLIRVKMWIFHVRNDHRNVIIKMWNEFENDSLIPAGEYNSSPVST